MTEQDRNSVDGIDKVLGEPFACEYSDKAWKIRTNLIASSVISICLVFARIEIDPSTEIFGVKFKGLNEDIIRLGLAIIIMYLLIHFIWYSIDNILEWRLRITGTRNAFITAGKFVSEHGDYPNDPRQTTLYNWWLENSKGFEDVNSRSSTVVKELDHMMQELRGKCKIHDNCSNITTTIGIMAEVREHLFKLTNSVDKAQKTIESNRIPASLRRFNRWYMYMMRSNNLRFLVVEFGFPVTLGATALVTLKTL